MAKLPPWIITIITSTAILWLTLAPKPLGDEAPHLFDGADKVVHALMFGALAVAPLLDWQRRRGWAQVSVLQAAASGAMAALAGTGIEYLQRYMAMGRGFEPLDMAADAIGAVCGAFLYKLIVK